MTRVVSWAAGHAAAAPAREALVDTGTGRRWSWAALDLEARCWAARLRAAGVGPGDRVAVLARNRGETFAVLFACADLGAILFPMNWRLSAPELAWQAGDCAPRVLLVDAASAEVGAGLGLPTLSLDAGPGCGPAARESLPGSDVDAPWQIMYTSGSTGKPKGALITHRQAFWNAWNTVLACDLDSASSTLTFTPLFHTGGMNCLSTPMFARGGRVVLMPALDVPEALRLVARERITHLMGVPTIYQMLADDPGFDAANLESVRDALCGGAPLALPLLERYQARGIPLRQGFGLTEAGPNCFSMPAADVLRKMRAQPELPTAGPAGSCVGRPMVNVPMRVVRPDGTDCAPGEAGELWVGGPVVCGGYWGRPDATAAAIVDGWFRTGDALSVDAEGFFYVRGRLKEMYKSGGENVYPAEVEQVIGGSPGVGQVAVLGVPDPRWGEVGHAFVEPAPGAELRGDDLLRWLDGRLARFKIPKRVTVMDALPRTGSGKIDKPALARLLSDRPLGS